MKRPEELVAALPRAVDSRDSTTWIGIILGLFLLLLLFPMGMLSKNEEYYFQVAAQFWSGAPHIYSAIQERSSHLFLTAAAIGIPVHLFGYETAGAILRIVTAAALAACFARLASVWRLSALDSILIVSIFVLLDQQYFGGEWIIRSVEGKVFAYVFVCLGLAQAFQGKWLSCMLAMIVATYFHFLVGGFWALVALAWLFYSCERSREPGKAALLYGLAVLPLAAMILWQRAEGAANQASIDTWYAYSMLRMPHHIAPFSNRLQFWQWTSGIVLLLSTLAASALTLKLDGTQNTKRLIRLLIGLQLYLILALLVSATETGVRLLGQFYLFRPSSLTLMLVIAAGFILYRQHQQSRLPVWVAAWLLVPMAGWSAIKEKVEEVAWRSADPPEVRAMIDAVTRSTNPSEVVLIQPGRDDEHPEVELSRLLPRPTLVSWEFAPTVPDRIETWLARDAFRSDLFANGCTGSSEYPVGALIVYNRTMPSEAVIDSCGRIVWAGPNYSVVDVR